MLRIRVIPCLLLRDSGLVKTTKFNDQKYIGDPINAVKIFNEKEVDELIFLDIDASKKGVEPDYALIKDLATECFMPFAYGGAVSNIDQIRKILHLGVEKVVINSAALNNPSFIKQACQDFGSSTIIGAIDVNKDFFGKYRVYNHVKKTNLKLNPEDYARTLEDLGVGELFINTVYRDGTYHGFDTAIMQSIAASVNIPVIACGGASKIEDFAEVVKKSGVSAVSAGSLFVYQGPHKAVLISYPKVKDLENLFK
jgi:cyclase